MSDHINHAAKLPPLPDDYYMLAPQRIKVYDEDHMHAYARAYAELAIAADRAQLADLQELLDLEKEHVRQAVGNLAKRDAEIADLRAQLASERQAKEYEQRHAAESEKALAKEHAENITLRSQLAQQGQGDTGALIAAADKYAEAYDGDDREGIKTDVINAFYAGSKFAAPASAQPAPKDTPESMAASNARFAIDGAIQFGRENRNAPPSTDHWLYEYWNIGQQLRELGKTGWDNVTPLATVTAPTEDYFLRSDGVEHSHPSYGTGIFFTEDCARAASTASERCPHCDGTGDVHTPTGEWRGACSCPAGAAPQQPAARVAVPDEQATKVEYGEYVRWCAEQGRTPMKFSTFKSFAFTADEVSATLAEPAAPAASQQSADHFVSMIMGKLDEYGLAVKDENADWRSRVRGEIFNALYAAPAAQQAAPISADRRFMDALDAYMDAVTYDERNSDKRIACRLEIFAAADAWRAAPATAGTVGLDAKDAALEQAAIVAENYGPSRPIVSTQPSDRIKGRWEGEQAASSTIAAIIRGMKSTATLAAQQAQASAKGEQA